MQCFAPGAFYTPQYKLYRKTKGRAGWNGKVTMVSNGGFLTGLLPYASTLLKKRHLELVPVRMLPSLKFGPIPDYLRDYQKDAVRASFTNSFAGLWHPRGVIEIATGGGKTLTAGAMIQMAQVPTAFLVHRDHLLHQTREEFESLGLTVGILGSGQNNIPVGWDVIVATAQTVYSANKMDDQCRLK